MRLMAPRKLFAGLPGSPRLWMMLFAASISAYGFFEVADFVFDDVSDGEEGAAAFDRPIAQFFQQFRSAALTGRAIEVSALGSAPVLAVFALLAYSVVLGARDRLGFLHLSIALLGAGLWPRLLQDLFERARPDGLLPSVVVTPGSFPSAHAFGAAACYATFAFFYARYAERLSTEVACYVLASAIVLLIGATRIYLGAHHATDVMAGISAGCAWAFLVAAIFSLWYGKPAARRSTSPAA
jgi:undecaprenyl-diphosphatase